MGELKLTKTVARRRRHLRIRQKVTGTGERPRLCVHRSLKHLYAQLIDDTTGSVLTTVSTRSPDARSKGASRCNIASARIVGEMLAEKAIELGKETVIFDRGGYRYHGRVKALADAAREKGLKF